MSRLTALFISFSLILPVLSGCASKYGEQRTAVNYYPACYAPIQDLRDREHNVAKSTAVGGVLGALGGALVGILATGKMEGAVMGAAVGGAGGLVAGNIYASKQQQADDNMRLASYLQDMEGDISHLDVSGAAAQSSLQCYNRQFNALIAAIKAKAVSREAAQARFAEIMSGREEANAILGQVVSNARALQQEYENAFIQEERNIQAPQKAAQGAAATQAKKQAINRGRQRSKQFSTVERKWQDVKTSANEETSRQQREIAAAIEANMLDVHNAEI